MIFSDQQLKAIHTWNQGVAILAGAGCGKTTTLVGKCLELLKRNPDAKICAISFTEKSTSDIKEKLGIELLNQGLGELRNHWVHTIHGFCARLIREFPDAVALDGEEKILSELEARKLWEESLDRLWQKNIPESIDSSLQPILESEGVSGTIDLLSRVWELNNFGVMKHLKDSSDFNCRCLYEVSNWVIGLYQQKKQRMGVLDYDDLERLALMILNQSQYRKEIQSRFDLVLIDEFQDTNSIQCQIAELVAKPSYSNLVIVGDPKQSIYRFRDADVSLFYEFVKKMPVQVELSENYRSSPKIIEFINQACERVFQLQSMDYVPLIPKKSPAPVEPLIAIQSVDPKMLAEFLFSEVQKGVPWESFCILLPKIKGNESLIYGLLRAGIPLVVASGGLFWSDPRVIEIVSFLRFWVDPRQRLSLAQWLRSPWMGFKDTDLDAWFTHPEVDLGSVFWSSSHSVARRLLPLRNRIVSVAEVLRELLSDPDLEKELGWVLLSLIFRAEEYSDQGLSFERIVDAFYESVQSKEREPVFPEPSGQGRVTLLTVHGSKGLEFPRVILPDLRKRPAPSAPVLFWNNQKGVYLNLKDSDGNRDTTSKAVLPWREFERTAELQESIRLFYVALTRAKEQLVFCYDPSEKPEIEKDHWSSWLEPEKLPHFNGLNETSISSFDDTKVRAEISTPEPAIERNHPVTLKRARYGITELGYWKECEKSAYHRVMGWSFDTDTDPQSQARKERGTQIHKALALMDFELLRKVDFNTQALEHWLSTSEWFQGGKARTELSFEIQLGNSVLVGAMDRLICREREAIVLDFKVSESKVPISIWAEKYIDQLHWYTLAVEQMEPKYKGRVQAVLVRISESQVEEYRIPFDPEFRASVIHRLERIRKLLIDPSDLTVTVGAGCEHCPLRSDCVERRQQIGEI
jgi:ATP-dependent exoDNAse (exonuclease V) beta subunit